MSTRRGVALILALGAIVVIGALVAGTLWATTQGGRGARDAALEARTRAAAELGARRIALAGEWSASWFAAPRGVVALRVYAPSSDVTDSVRVVKLADGCFLMLSDASAIGLATQRRVTLLYTLADSTDLPILARERSYAEQ